MHMYSLTDIACAAQMAIALEVSAMLKPGNVDPIHDFKDTRYEHFLASAVAFGPTARKAAARGRRAVMEDLPLSHVGLGKLIEETVTYAGGWHRGRNTILGTAALLLPLAAGAGAAFASNQPSTNIAAIRHWTREVCKATEVDDAVMFYRALKAVNPGGLNAVTHLNVPDALDPSAEAKLCSMGLTLFDVMERCRRLDAICGEWASGMRIVFTEGYPTLWDAYEKTGSLRAAASHCFLTILAKHEDTLIRRKAGTDAAEAVSRWARKALEKGGIHKPSGVKEIVSLDAHVRRSGNRLNPGATADITATALMVGLLSGLKP